MRTTTIEELPPWARDIMAIVAGRRGEIELVVLIGPDPIDHKLTSVVVADPTGPAELALLATILVESATRLVGLDEAVARS